MWILLRIVAAVCGVLYRYISASWGDEPSERIGEVAYSEKRRENKRGDRTYHRIGVRLTTSICFAITKESSWDGFFKRVGLSREFQTGDRNFDKRIYIASDHLELCDALRDNAELRKLIRGLFRDGVDKIWSNGYMLYAAAKKPLATKVYVARLDRIRIELVDAAATAPSRFGDPFFWRALVVESIVWGMAGYAAVAVLDLIINRQDYHLDQGRLLVYGAAGAGIVALGLLALIVLFLQRSSRSHRILVESAVLLVLSTPVFGVQVVADINHGGDAALPIVVRSRVRDHWREEHRSKRGTRHSHHMYIDHIEGEVPLSGKLDISPAVFWTLTDGAEIPIAIGRGRLGLRWYKSINGIPVM